MRTKGIMQTKKDERREKILTEAYRIFVEKKIEPPIVLLFADMFPT